MQKDAEFFLNLKYTSTWILVSWYNDHVDNEFILFSISYAGKRWQIRLM